MIYTEYIKIVNSVVHIVGNKSNDEGLFLSDNLLELDPVTSSILTKYLLSPFKNENYYRFWHETDLSLNEIYSFSQAIFSDSDSFHDNSAFIARHLYAKSTHPKIKSGELCVVHFRNVIIDTDTCDAIGIFKSESKDTFLKIRKDGGRTLMQSEEGINVNHLDKGCLIFNKKKDNGYVVMVVDNTNKQAEAKYWTDDFLKVKPINNGYNQTESLISITREFIATMPSLDGKVEKANMVNRSLEALKTEHLDFSTYSEQVFQNPEIQDKFKEYSNRRTEEIGVSFSDGIQPSTEAVRKKGIGSMTIIKLDKNFDVNIHGGEQFIERGYDEERGMKYYKLFFNEEK